MMHLCSFIFLNETSLAGSTCPHCGFAAGIAVGLGEAARRTAAGSPSPGQSEPQIPPAWASLSWQRAVTPGSKRGAFGSCQLAFSLSPAPLSITWGWRKAVPCLPGVLARPWGRGALLQPGVSAVQKEPPGTTPSRGIEDVRASTAVTPAPCLRHRSPRSVLPVCLSWARRGRFIFCRQPQVLLRTPREVADDLAQPRLPLLPANLARLHREPVTSPGAPTWCSSTELSLGRIYNGLARKSHFTMLFNGYSIFSTTASITVTPEC